MFRLIPYPVDDLPELQITGKIERLENRLSIHYVVRGDVERILLPMRSDPARKNDLWKATCFEFFLAILDRPEYWEFNLSPSSEWNAYHMDAYRQVNMREETKIRQLPFDFHKNGGISLDISLELDPIARPGQSLEIGISAVIQTKDESEIYWALAHPGKQADFHLRESFILQL